MKRKLVKCFHTGQRCVCEMHPQPDHVFAIMPFVVEFTDVFESIAHACLRNGLTAVRVDSTTDAHNIVCRICQLIHVCGLIVADVSEPNPNVYYELGLSHAPGKEVALVSQDPSGAAFDIRVIKMIPYDRHDLSAFRKLFEEYLYDWIARRRREGG